MPRHPPLRAGDRWRLCSCARLLRRRATGPSSEDDAFEQAVAHHAVAAVRATGDLAAGIDTLERCPGVRVDQEAAVLVVKDGVGQDLLAQRVDPGAAIAA